MLSVEGIASLSKGYGVCWSKTLIVGCDFRLTGFLLGATLSGGGMYYYVLNEYRISNELLTEDIFVSESTPSFVLYITRKVRLMDLWDRIYRLQCKG